MATNGGSGVSAKLLVVLVAAVLSLGQGLLFWSMTSARAERDDLLSADRRNLAEITVNAKDIARIQAQYDEILRRLDTIERKLP